MRLTAENFGESVRSNIGRGRLYKNITALASAVEMTRSIVRRVIEAERHPISGSLRYGYATAEALCHACQIPLDSIPEEIMAKIQTRTDFGNRNPASPRAIFGCRLNTIRKKKGLKIAEIAEATGLTLKDIKNVFWGDAITLPVAQRICNALEVNHGDIPVAIVNPDNLLAKLLALPVRQAEEVLRVYGDPEQSSERETLAGRLAKVESQLATRDAQIEVLGENLAAANQLRQEALLAVRKMRSVLGKIQGENEQLEEELRGSRAEIKIMKVKLQRATGARLSR
ncbi:MAG: helix-turn-helix domain-containing protein [Patescibacteria group bacterium]